MKTFIKILLGFLGYTLANDAAQKEYQKSREDALARQNAISDKMTRERRMIKSDGTRCDGYGNRV